MRMDMGCCCDKSGGSGLGELGFDPSSLIPAAFSLIGGGSGPASAGSPAFPGASAAPITVSPQISTQVSPQISPVFQQQFQPSNSPASAGTSQNLPAMPNAYPSAGGYAPMLPSAGSGDPFANLSPVYTPNQASMLPSIPSQYMPWIIGGAAALLLLAAFKKKRGPLPKEPF